MARRRRRSTAIRRSSGASPKYLKLQNRVNGAQRKRALEKKQRIHDLSSIAGGVALGLLDKSDFENPIDIPGIDDAAVYGVLLYLIGDRFMSGKMGEVVRGGAVGMLACAARDAANGEAA